MNRLKCISLSQEPVCKEVNSHVLFLVDASLVMSLVYEGVCGQAICMYENTFHTGDVHTRFRHLRAHMSLTLDKDQEVYARLQTELRDRAVSFSSVRMSKPDLYDPTFGVQKRTGLAEPRSLLGMTHFQLHLPFAYSYTAARGQCLNAVQCLEVV